MSERPDPLEEDDERPIDRNARERDERIRQHIADIRAFLREGKPLQ